MAYKDWFQDFVGIATYASQVRGEKGANVEAEIVRRLNQIVDFLEREQVKNSDGNLVINHARQEYSEQLKLRARDFYQRMRANSNLDLNEARTNTDVGNLVRHYYHDAYYCYYYCMRLFLVKNKTWDTNIHEKIDSLLEDLAKKSDANNDIIMRRIGTLKSLRKTRERADYIIRDEVLRELTEEHSYSEILRQVDLVITEMGINS